MPRFTADHPNKSSNGWLTAFAERLRKLRLMARVSAGVKRGNQCLDARTSLSGWMRSSFPSPGTAFQDSLMRPNVGWSLRSENRTLDPYVYSSPFSIV